MKDKFTVTISDVNGVRQYTYEQVVKIVIKWTLLALIVLGVLGWLAYKSFPCKEQHLEDAKLSQKIMILKTKQQDLNKHQKVLQEIINTKNQQLVDIDRQLQKFEKITGVVSDTNKSIIQRIQITQDNVLQKIKETKKAVVVKMAVKEIEKKPIKTSKVLPLSKITLLNQMIPNGKPVKKFRLISRYGYRTHPITKRMEFHPGIDMAAAIGTPVFAPADGVVTYAKQKSGYGKYMLISHSFGFKTVYGHLSDFACAEGTYVKKGDIIAYVGNSGKSIEPHLHYEVRYLNKWLDPEPFLLENPKTLNEIQKRNTMVNWAGLIDQIKLTQYK